MARSGVLYLHVAQAATQLVAAGHNPTIDSIRVALGGTGSKSTIAPLLKRWKAAHPGTLAQAELGLPAELVLALKGLYEKVQAEAAVQLQQAVAAHQAEADALQEQLQQAFVERDAQLSVQEQQAQALAVATTRSQGLADTLQRQEIALASLGSEKTGLEQRLADRAAEAAALTRQLQQAREQFGGWGAMELKTNVSRIRVRFTRQRLRINEL